MPFWLLLSGGSGLLAHRVQVFLLDRSSFHGRRFFGPKGGVEQVQ